MICRLRSFFLLLIVFVVSAPFSRAQQGGTTRIEETDPSITYSGTWFTNGGENNSGGGAALTNSTGARAVVTFTGTGISWIGVGDRWNGLATVTLDGLPSKVTVARPFHRSPTPIQLMPVPVKVTTARAPVEFVRAALPPLLFSPPLVNQVPLYVILGSVSSIRVVPPCWALLNGALTSNILSKRKKLRRR